MDKLRRYSSVLLTVPRHVNTHEKQIAFVNKLGGIITRFQIDVVDRQVKQTGKTEFSEINESCKKIINAAERLSSELASANMEGMREISCNLYEAYTKKFYKDDSQGNRRLIISGSDEDLFEPMKEFLILCNAIPDNYAIQELLESIVDASNHVLNSDNHAKRKGKDVVSSLTKKLIANLAGLYCSYGGKDSHSEKSIFPKLVNEVFTLIGVYKSPHEQIKEAKKQDYYELEKSKFYK